jgi:ABC-type branched-subunit amino acid transport system substrate-binding protein
MRKVAMLVLGVAASVALLAGCGGSDSSSSTGSGSSTSAATSGGVKPGEVVKVGYIGTLSGPLGASEVTILDGFKAGLDYVNQQGPAEGVKYELLVRDAADPTKAAAAARELAQQGVKAIFGPRGSFAGIQPILNQSKIIGINSNLEGMYDQLGDNKQYPWSFGTGETEVDRTQLQTTLVGSATKSGSVAQISDATPFGKASSAATTEQMKAFPNVKLVSAEFPLTATDVSKQLSDLKATGAKTLFVWTFGDFLIKVAAGLTKTDWHPQVVTIVGAKYTPIIDAMEKADPGITKNMIGGPIPNGFVKTADNPEPTGVTKAFIDTFKKYQKGSTATDGNTLVATYGFDGAVIINAAIALSHSTDTEKMKAGLTSGKPIDGVRGTYVFGPDVRLAQDIAKQASLIEIGAPCPTGLCQGVTAGG